MVIEQLLVILIVLDIVIIFGIGTTCDAVDGIALKMYGKSGCSLMQEHRRNKIKERKERRKRCKIITKSKEE